MKHTQKFILEALADGPRTEVEIARHVKRGLGKKPFRLDKFIGEMQGGAFIKEMGDGQFALTSRGEYALTHNRLPRLK